MNGKFVDTSSYKGLNGAKFDSKSVAGNKKPQLADLKGKMGQGVPRLN